MGKNVLVTGPPRSGKSTLIERVTRRIQRPMTGFITREIREEGQRVGFSIHTLEGRKGILAHHNIKGGKKVGKYGVNLIHIDQIAVPSMVPTESSQVVIIDEIGKMECFSALFRQTLIKVLDSENPVLASIAQKGDRFVQRIKEREDILLVQVSEKNRDELVNFAKFYEL